MSLDDQIAVLEERVINAATSEGSAKLMDRLNALYVRKHGPSWRLPGSKPRPTGEKPGPTRVRSRDYERGYNSGYRAAQRKAYADSHPECNHEGIGYPWCPTCRPRTIAALREMGVTWTDRASEPPETEDR